MDEKQIGIKIKTSLSGKTTKELKDYADQLSRIQAFSKGLDKGALKQIDNSGKSLDQNSKSLEQIEKNTRRAFNIQGITAYLTIAKNLVTTLGKLTNKSAEYTENINLYQVAFDGATKEADAFVNKLSEMYGLDESWLTRTTGIFKQLSNAMSLGVEEGTKLSKLMTQMSIDISSLYNIDIERASSILQSSLAGQTKPIRGATGADITQNTLQMTLDNIGIEKAVTNLSFAEKRLLIIISLTQQLNQATNDFGKTIESPANQMRILNEQWERLSRSVGNVFLPVLAKILPYLNAIMMVLTEIINTIASFFGYSLEDYDFGVSSTADSVLELEDALNGAGESAKKLKSGLRGFDKLNVISTPSSGASGAGSGGGIDPEIMNAFNKSFDEYNNKLKDVKMKATEIRDNIMEWLGFTKEIDQETGKVSFKFDHITGGTVLGALAVGGGIYSGIVTISRVLSAFKILEKPLPGLTTIFSNLSKLSGLKGTIMPIINTVVGLGLTFWGVTEAIKGVIDIIKGDFKSGIFGVLKGVGLMVTGIALLFGGWTVALVAGLITAGIFITEWLVENWESVKTWCSEVWNSIYSTIFEPVVNFVSGIADTIYNLVIKPVIDFFKPIVMAITEVFELIIEKVSEIVVGIGKAIKSIIDKIVEIFLKIVEISVALGKAFYVYVISPIIEFIAGIAEKIYEKVIKPVVNFFKKVGEWAYDNIIKPIWDKIVWLRDKAVELFKKIGTTVVNFISNTFKSVINGILSSIENGINGFIKLLNKAIDIINDIPGVEITKVSLLKIPRLEKGMDFVPKDFYGPVYLDYGERVLTKEENRQYSEGGGLNNNNNNQIRNNSSFNPTFIIQVGSKEVAKTVLTDLQDMAKSNGKPIIIQG